MTGGDFSAEAYEQLREAYAKQTGTQLEAETRGVEVMGQRLTLETLPVDSPWKSKIDNWEYPAGRSEYLDGKQDPAEILEIMRGAAQERVDAEKLEEAQELVAEAEADTDAEAEAEDIDDDEEGLDLNDMSDEELDAFVDQLLEEIAEDEVSEDEENSDIDALLEETISEDEEAEEAEEVEEAKETEEEYDLQDVADEISRLKTELDNMRFVPTEDPEENA